MADVSVYNPDLPDGPDNKKPKGKSDALAPADAYREQQKRLGGQTEFKNRGGRPATVIDWMAFADLCAIFCTKEEIAGFFKCSEDTIERAIKKEFGDQYTFSIVWNECAAPGKISLRRAQLKAAEKGNVLAQIWLGKQYLGQRDTPAPALPEGDKETDDQVQDVYGLTFVGSPGQEFTLVNAPPEAVRPSNASNPGPDSSAPAPGPAPE